MRETLSRFVAELRGIGIPVSIAEHLDAARAVLCLPLEDRQSLKRALGATLVKSSTHQPAFDTAFEIFFGARHPLDDGGVAGDDAGAPEDDPFATGSFLAPEPGSDPAGPLGMHGGPTTDDRLMNLLLRALLGGDAAAMRVAASRAVDRHAGIQAGRPVGGAYYLYRTLHRLDLDALEARLLAASHEDAAVSALEARLLADEYRARMERLKGAIEAEIRRRLVLDRGPGALAESTRRTLLEDVEVMHANADELAQLRRALIPLSRKLAARVARRRRARRSGTLDIRSTIRASLSSGGVPLEPRFRHKRPSRPELFVVADVSGSVASFARFTLYLVHAIATQFSRVRSFVFVDGIDEVTDRFGHDAGASAVVDAVVRGADVVWLDGHSDYGHALSELERRWGDEITDRTSVLVLGDARNNYHASGAWVLDALHRRARRVLWLNPEPRRYWGSGDSIIDEYAPFCDAVVECRTLRQLERFVTQLA